jgi:predicted cupin superfamily sugar epimerase
MNDAAAAVIRQFNLEPHPEGGWFREIFRSPHRVLSGDVERSALTVIHYLLSEGMHSAWHRVDADEVWIFSDGDPIEQLVASPDFSTVIKRRLIDVTPVSVVPAGWWQAAYTRGEWALVQCAVGPGFEYTGFELARENSASGLVREDLAWLL